MSSEQPKSLQQIAAETPYPIEALHFVRRGLDFTVRRLHQNPETLADEQRHVSGRQLSEGLVEFALQHYGHMARTVLRRWRINRTEDFGKIVFAMVDGGLMQASEGDSEHDFDHVLDLDAALEAPIPLDRVPLEGFEPQVIEQG